MSVDAAPTVSALIEKVWPKTTESLVHWSHRVQAILYETYSNSSLPLKWPQSFPKGSDSNFEHARHAPRWCETSSSHSDLGPMSMEICTES